MDKEVKFYHKEAAENEAIVQKLKDEGKDAFDMKQAQECLQEVIVFAHVCLFRALYLLHLHANTPVDTFHPSLPSYLVCFLSHLSHLRLSFTSEVLHDDPRLQEPLSKESRRSPRLSRRAR